MVEKYTARYLARSGNGSDGVVLAADYDALTRELAQCKEWHANWLKAEPQYIARVAALEAALRDLLDDVGEVTGERHHRDKYRVYQISPQTMTAARAVLTPAPKGPYPWCRQPSVCRGTCPMDPSCGE